MNERTFPVCRGSAWTRFVVAVWLFFCFVFLGVFVGVFLFLFLFVCFFVMNEPLCVRHGSVGTCGVL